MDYGFGVIERIQGEYTYLCICEAVWPPIFIGICRNTADPFSRTSKPFLDSPCLVTHWKIVRNLPDVWQVRLQEDSWFMHAGQKLKSSYDDEENRFFTTYSYYGKLCRIP